MHQLYYYPIIICIVCHWPFFSLFSNHHLHCLLLGYPQSSSSALCICHWECSNHHCLRCFTITGNPHYRHGDCCLASPRSADSLETAPCAHSHPESVKTAIRDKHCTVHQPQCFRQQNSIGVSPTICWTASRPVSVSPTICQTAEQCCITRICQTTSKTQPLDCVSSTFCQSPEVLICHPVCQTTGQCQCVIHNLSESSTVLMCHPHSVRQQNSFSMSSTVCQTAG